MPGRWCRWERKVVTMIEPQWRLHWRAQLQNPEWLNKCCASKHLYLYGAEYNSQKQHRSDVILAAQQSGLQFKRNLPWVILSNDNIMFKATVHVTSNLHNQTNSEDFRCGVRWIAAQRTTECPCCVCGASMLFPQNIRALSAEFRPLLYHSHKEDHCFPSH